MEVELEGQVHGQERQDGTLPQGRGGHRWEPRCRWVGVLDSGRVKFSSEDLKISKTAENEED